MIVARSVLHNGSKDSPNELGAWRSLWIILNRNAFPSNRNVDFRLLKNIARLDCLDKTDGRLTAGFKKYFAR